MATAHIDSPDVLKTFRERFVKFDAECRQALAAVSGDVNQVGEWLRREQLAHWKRELQRREEKVLQARLDYIRATQEDKYHRKVSGVDEKKALEKAMRLKQEAEQKIDKVKRWILTLDQKTSKLLLPCSSFSSHLERTTPVALGRLDRLLDKLDDYLRPSATPQDDKGTT